MMSFAYVKQIVYQEFNQHFISTHIIADLTPNNLTSHERETEKIETIQNKNKRNETKNSGCYFTVQRHFELSNVSRNV